MFTMTFDQDDSQDVKLAAMQEQQPSSIETTERPKAKQEGAAEKPIEQRLESIKTDLIDLKEDRAAIYHRHEALTQPNPELATAGADAEDQALDTERQLLLTNLEKIDERIKVLEREQAEAEAVLAGKVIEQGIQGTSVMETISGQSSEASKLEDKQRALPAELDAAIEATKQETPEVSPIDQKRARFQKAAELTTAIAVFQKDYADPTKKAEQNAIVEQWHTAYAELQQLFPDAKTPEEVKAASEALAKEMQDVAMKEIDAVVEADNKTPIKETELHISDAQHVRVQEAKKVVEDRNLALEAFKQAPFPIKLDDPKLVFTTKDYTNQQIADGTYARDAQETITKSEQGIERRLFELDQKIGEAKGKAEKMELQREKASLEISQTNQIQRHFTFLRHHLPELMSKIKNEQQVLELQVKQAEGDAKKAGQGLDIAPSVKQVEAEEDIPVEYDLSGMEEQKKIPATGGAAAKETPSAKELPSTDKEVFTMGEVKPLQEKPFVMGDEKAADAEEEPAQLEQPKAIEQLPTILAAQKVLDDANKLQGQLEATHLKSLTKKEEIADARKTNYQLVSGLDDLVRLQLRRGIAQSRVAEAELDYQSLNEALKRSDHVQLEDRKLLKQKLVMLNAAKEVAKKADEEYKAKQKADLNKLDQPAPPANQSETSAKAPDTDTKSNSMPSFTV